MQIERTAIPDVLIVRPKKFGDERGFFSETFKAAALEAFGVHHSWVQDNHSFSAAPGVVRGLHFQVGEHAQAKLIRVTRGALLDVAVDIRKGSPTYGRHVAVELSAENWTQLYIPIGFAHGFVTTAPNTEALYKVTTYWSQPNEGGVLWNDPDLGIAWPIPASEATINARDAGWPRLKDFDSPFVYAG
ncbi:MAG TPA: dTDP-4-dehydrorhamnose 3,5-epimerase [Caulobacterales bacterium]|nr:dTDP-4-dehydrorhamnose 3,5-epimerase [Caulobacterales bacterium]